MSVEAALDPALLHACDVNYWHGDAALFGASLRGEVIESHALHLCSCGFRAADFNRLRLKRADALAASLARGEAWFGERGLPWRVELRSELEPECKGALHERGYTRVRETPGMVLAPIRAGERAVPGLEIRRVATEADLARFQRAAFEGFGLPGRLGPLFLTPALWSLPGVELFLGLVDGEPAATSCLVVSPGVAGIYWVSTLPAQRGRGLGEALTWAAVRAGMEAGCGVASLQASEMGAPVYARMGFATPLRYALWDPPAAGGAGDAAGEHRRRELGRGAGDGRILHHVLGGGGAVAAQPDPRALAVRGAGHVVLHRRHGQARGRLAGGPGAGAVADGVEAELVAREEGVLVVEGLPAPRRARAFAAHPDEDARRARACHPGPAPLSCPVRGEVAESG